MKIELIQTEDQQWRDAALRLGEELATVGPDHYYDFTPTQWLDWTLENVIRPKIETAN